MRHPVIQLKFFLSTVDSLFAKSLVAVKKNVSFINKRNTGREKNEYWLTRFIILRLLGVIYLFAFISLATQVIPLIGDSGLLPADNYLKAVASQFDSPTKAFLELPTIFWFHLSNSWLVFFSWLGVALSIILLLGWANSILMFGLWFLYMSFVHIGQLWYSYGWEIQLLEIGFLAIFFVPLLDARPFPKYPPPLPIIWLLRWLTFRIYLGAGLIKIRGDECWRKLTCMYYHYETQPIPNPISPWLHYLPNWFHRIETLANHFIELIVPFFVFWPRLLRIVAGILFISFQLFLIISGNLSFLNWLTILPALALLDDKFLKKILPKRLVKKAAIASYQEEPVTQIQKIIIVTVFVALAWFSFPVVANLTSSRQIMNTSFNQWHLVNTYGAFGSIGQKRFELVVEGTQDEVITEQSVWQEYEFRAKPTGLNRGLPVIAPYQPRIDWQIWFAAMSIPERQPWLIHFVWKLLHNDQATISLISHNPFPNSAPKHIRIEIYQYQFNKPWQQRQQGVWQRQYLGHWLQPLSVDSSGLRQFIQANNWELY